MKVILTRFLFITLCVVANGTKTRMEFQSQNETCVIQCFSTLDGDLCKSICGDNATLYEDYKDLDDDPEEKEKSIIEAGKVYNSRLNVVVYSLMTGGISTHTFIHETILVYVLFTRVQHLHSCLRCLSDIQVLSSIRCRMESAGHNLII